MTVVESPIPADPAPNRALFVASRLLIAGDAFFFLGFLFAYLYLRSLDSNHHWHPAGTDPSLALGTVVVAATVLAALTARMAAAGDRRPLLAASLGLVLLALVVQGVQLVDPGFSPSHGGGYGAVFVGFAAAFAVHLLGILYWLETLTVDREAGDTERGAQVRAASLFMGYLAGVAVVAYILLYLV